MAVVIISGGQTGADQGGLLAGVELQFNTGGYAPKGWRTEAGPNPSLEEYGLVECEDDNYRTRTSLNVGLGDATVIFGKRSPGSNKTEELCRVNFKPCCWVLWPCTDNVHMFVNPARTTIIDGGNVRAFRLWLRRNDPKFLNVVGNRESVNPGIGEFVKSFLIKALQ